MKAGKANVEAPVYSHNSYDIVPGEKIVVDRPDILIVEGLNVLQPAKLPRHGEAVPFVSDFFDFSIYIDAEPAIIEKWYVTRFLRLWQTSFRDKSAYFYRYSKLTKEQAIGPGARAVAGDQPRQFEEEHPADAPARELDPKQRRRSSR